MTVDRDFNAVVQLAQESHLGKLTARAGRIFSAAQESSLVVGFGSHYWAAIKSWPAERQVRLAASIVAWGALGHLAGRLVLPPYVLSGLPPWWPATVLIAALVVVAIPDAFVRAWLTRRHRV